jgi:Mrp family chromosome partitioning ATPase/capsular polysaccharide biosynthesis protein
MDNSSVSLSDLGNVLRRRLRLIVAATVVATLAMLVFSWMQAEEHRASATLALTQVAPPRIADVGGGAQDADRYLQTQARRAESVDVAERTLRAANVNDRTPREFLNQSDVTVEPNADLLHFAVSDADPDVAQELASVYAREFADFQRAEDLGPLEDLRTTLEDSLTQIERRLPNAAPALAPLLRSDARRVRNDIRALDSYIAVNGGARFIASDAEQAVQTQPKTERNLAIGVLVGLVLGTVLAFLLDPLDTRIRSGQEVVTNTELPLLGRIPRPRRALVRSDQLVMMAEPSSPHAEAIRILRARLDVGLPTAARTVMVTSAVPHEGKSTTAGNLAFAYAEAGRDVILVDLDLGRPSLHRYLGLPPSPGVVDVLERRAALTSALHEMPLPGTVASNGGANTRPEGSRRDDSAGRLRVLPAGTLTGDPVRLLSSNALDELLATLARHDALVLVDAAPLLPVSHAVILGSKVDAVLAVAHAAALDRAAVHDFVDTLKALPAIKLGVVLTGVATMSAYPAYYGYGTPAGSGVESRQ